MFPQQLQPEFDIPKHDLPFKRMTGNTSESLHGFDYFFDIWSDYFLLL
jgi:hypothetical protein